MLALFPFKLKFQSKEDKNIYSFVAERFGYKPKNLAYFKKALTHKSVIPTNNHLVSNERLEFLGDAILDAVVAEYLFMKFPDEDEGYLTKIKSKLVNRKTLGEIGHEMEIELVLDYNKGRSIKIETIEGNAFEALIGAIYLDSDLNTVKNCIQKHVFKKYVDLNQVLQEEIDFKSRLFIWSQKNRLPINFEVVNEENRGGEWFYKVLVYINDKEYGLGTGSSKKKAEQSAAKETLELLGEL